MWSLNYYDTGIKETPSSGNGLFKEVSLKIRIIKTSRIQPLRKRYKQNNQSYTETLRWSGNSLNNIWQLREVVGIVDYFAARQFLHLQQGFTALEKCVHRWCSGYSLFKVCQLRELVGILDYLDNHPFLEIFDFFNSPLTGFRCSWNVCPPSMFWLVTV